MFFKLNTENKVVLVTGGYGFLGKSIVISLIEHGAKVYVLGRSLEKFNLAFSKSKLKSLPVFEQCDVSSTKSIKNAFKNIVKEENKIDVLINNAFYSKGQSPETMTDEDWKFGIEGTLDSTFKCIREIIPYFKKKKSGKIINVSSMYGIVAPDFDVYLENPTMLNPPHYGASKAGIIQLTKYYASYLGKEGVQVNTVTPGPFPSTEVQEKKGFINQLATKTCLKKIGTPEDLAGSFVFLASSAADYITGQNIIVDGGWTIK